jgi:hypothetical protein
MAIINSSFWLCLLQKGAFYIQKVFYFRNKIQSAGFALQREISLQNPLTLRRVMAILQGETIKQSFNRFSHV